MKIDLKNDSKVFIRPYEERDFYKIQDLNKEEGWTDLVQNNLNTKKVWENSNISFVVETKSEELIGYIRGHTDKHVSLFICEING
ncbi:MAG TPA: hypothetical protein VK072_07140 [Candidatus Avamphibacillus sp.]|nr:hypothetical protein [Candidatus Avamphibacillus sp.]